ncbi:MAG: fibronectin type III domain-containing protein [Bacteroidales bacterium]|nr:fibronectin type III domain-containing protein [Bacteroidales bacterium]
MIYRKTLLFAAVIISVLTACNKKAPEPVALAAPSPEVAVLGIDKVTLLWETVENAESYRILLDEKTVIKASGVCAVIENLTSGTEYKVMMKSIAPEGSSQWLDSGYGPVLTFVTKGKTVLQTPEVEVYEAEPSSVTLVWEPVKKAGMYVYTFNGGAQQQTTETSVTFDDLNFDTEYVFRIKAVPDEQSVETALESAWGETTVKTPDRYVLDTPVLSVSDINTNGFTVNWNEVPDAGSYEYSVNGSPAVAVDDLKAVLTGLTAATEYTVTVRAVPAVSDQGSYVASDWAQIKATTNGLIVLGAPVLKSENVLATQFTVKWEAVEHAGSYMVSLNGGEFISVSGNSRTFTDLSTETAYTVKVKAVPDASQTGTYKESPLSEISVTTKQGPSPDDKGGDLSDFDEDPIF